MGEDHLSRHKFPLTWPVTALETWGGEREAESQYSTLPSRSVPASMKKKTKKKHGYWYTLSDSHLFYKINVDFVKQKTPISKWGKTTYKNVHIYI